MNTITRCRVCGSQNIRLFFHLGKQPLANSLLASPSDPEELYPLSLSFCDDCSLVQLNETIDPAILFSEYVWVSGTSKVAQEFSQIFYQQLIDRISPEGEGYILEIASNDGTFLRPFIQNGHHVVGVDPAQNIAQQANEDGIFTVCDFWGSECAQKMLKERGAARAIFARNVLPHVANTQEFVQGIAECVHPEGTVAIEVHYAGTILEGLHYDSIYHEHLCYFSFRSLEKLLNRHGLHVFDIGKSPISGGSIVVYATRSSAKTQTQIVQKYRDQEQETRTNTFERWQEFALRSEEHRDALVGMIRTMADKGKVVVGWGASARSSTLTNFCAISPELVPLIADLNPLKQGRYTAGTHTQILHPTEVMKLQPDCVFISAWNFAEEISAHLQKEYHFDGDLLIPLPGSPVLHSIASFSRI